MRRKHRGDKGFTDLYCGGRVIKDDVRCEACGGLDELCSFLGLLKTCLKNKKIKSSIEMIQKDLFVIGTEIVTNPKKIYLLKKRIEKNNIDSLEKIINNLQKRIPQPKGFAIPGKNKISSLFHIARTLARKLERRIVTLKRKRMLKNDFILVYLNRLSLFLYLLALSYEKKK